MKKGGPFLVGRSSKKRRCRRLYNASKNDDDDDDENEISSALHQPTQCFGGVSKSVANRVPNEMRRPQTRFVSGNTNAIRDAPTLENHRRRSLVERREITIERVAGISRHDGVKQKMLSGGVAASFRNSLRNAGGRRGEALCRFLFPPSSSHSSAFEASENVVAKSFGDGSINDESLGVFANAAIKKNAKIFELGFDVYHPLSSSFALHSARMKAPQFIEAAKRITPGFEVHACMALNLLLDSSSYRVSCPLLTGQTDPSVPLLWDASQVALLRGTPTFDKVVTRKTFVKNAHAGIFGEENTAVSVDMFAWAISTVLSRALNNKENSFYSFMPGVDLLNHDANANCEIGLVSNTDTKNGKTSTTNIEVYAVRDIEKDEECTISYGNERSNDELLRKYGFCVPNNPNDFIDLRLRGTNLKVHQKNVLELLENNEEKRDEFVSNYNRSEVLDAIAEQKAALDEVANEENALLLGQSKWAEAIRLLRKGQYETLEATERVFK